MTRHIVAAAIVLLGAVATGAAAGARTQRSPEVPRAFQHEHPCPSTGRAYGRCPGFIRDHVVPLCAGGADAPSNMQWQTTEDAHAKDRVEWWQCRHRFRWMP